MALVIPAVDAGREAAERPGVPANSALSGASR